MLTWMSYKSITGPLQFASTLETGDWRLGKRDQGRKQLVVWFPGSGMGLCATRHVRQNRRVAVLEKQSTPLGGSGTY